MPHASSNIANTAPAHAGRCSHHARNFPLGFFAAGWAVPSAVSWLTRAWFTRAITLWLNPSPGSLRLSASRRSSSEKCISYLSNLARQALAQVSQRAMQRALHGVHRHFQNFSNLGRAQPLLKPHDHHQALLFRQSRQDLLQPLQQHGIGGGRSCSRLRSFFQRHLTTAMLLSSLVNAAVGRDPPQPVHKVRRRLYAIEGLKQLQKNFLRQVFRQRPVLKKVIGNAEDHSLMLSHQFGKGLCVTIE